MKKSSQKKAKSKINSIPSQTSSKSKNTGVKKTQPSSISTTPSKQNIVLKLLKIISVPTFLTFLYYLTVELPAEISIEGINNNSKTINTESYIKIKNIGKLPATEIVAELRGCRATIGTIYFNGSNSSVETKIISRLSGGESAEISTTPGWLIESNIAEFDYTLNLKYNTSLPILNIKFSHTKKWNVKLKHFQDGYTWNVLQK